MLPGSVSPSEGCGGEGGAAQPPVVLCSRLTISSTSILKCVFALSSLPYGPIQELKKAILEDMVKLGKQSGLHSFEQVNITFPILVTTLHAVLKIKLTRGDPDLHSPLPSTPAMLRPTDRLCTDRPLQACSKPTLQQAALCAKLGRMSSETVLVVLVITDVYKAEILP